MQTHEFQAQMQRLTPENQQKVMQHLNELYQQPWRHALPDDFEKYRIFIGSHTNEAVMGVPVKVFLWLAFSKDIEDIKMSDMIALVRASEHANCNFNNWMRFAKDQTIESFQEFKLALHQITEDINAIVEPFMQSTINRFANAQRLGVNVGNSIALPKAKA